MNKIAIGNSIAIEGAVSVLLQALGEDVTREGLHETPARVAKAWAQWTEGYDQDPKDVLKAFESGGYNQMVIVKDIPVYSKCEHHLADIFGVATVAYIPNGRVVGLSKLSRLVNIYARRLQVQERMTDQIADALITSEHLKPIGVGVHLNCRHMCMESRGVCQHGQFTMTTALRGELLNVGPVRAEFMALIG